MPKNTKGGSGHKKTKNTSGLRGRKIESMRKNPDPAELESYGKVTKASGNRRFVVDCQKPGTSGVVTISCVIRGSMRHRVNTDNYVLVKHFGFSNQAQIIDVYSQDEVELLKSYGYWDYSDAPSSGDKSKSTYGDDLISDDDDDACEDADADTNADTDTDGKDSSNEDEADETRADSIDSSNEDEANENRADGSEANNDGEDSASSEDDYDDIDNRDIDVTPKEDLRRPLQIAPKAKKRANDTKKVQRQSKPVVIPDEEIDIDHI